MNDLILIRLIFSRFSGFTVYRFFWQSQWEMIYDFARGVPRIFKTRGVILFSIHFLNELYKLHLPCFPAKSLTHGRMNIVLVFTMKRKQMIKIYGAFNVIVYHSTLFHDQTSGYHHKCLPFHYSKGQVKGINELVNNEYSKWIINILIFFAG